MSLAHVATGKQFVLESGGQTATVTEVGAVLRSYTVAGRELLDGFGPDETPWDTRGSTVMPWTGGPLDGRYTFGGAELTQPDTGTDVHGLTRWAPWRLVSYTPQRMVLRETVYPQPGYPFHLRCDISFALSSAGLRVETTATNVGAADCPFATGARPYLTLGTPAVDDLTVQVPAESHLIVDDRDLPSGSRPVEETAYDLRQPTRLGTRHLDTTYTALARDEDGVARVVLRAPTGEAMEVWMDAMYAYVHLSTRDAMPDRARRRRGLKVAPMTATTDAFRCGEGLIVLEPLQSCTAVWGLRPLSD